MKSSEKEVITAIRKELEMFSYFIVEAPDWVRDIAIDYWKKRITKKQVERLCRLSDEQIKSIIIGKTK